ncbi:MAG: leucine-rich repeat domain-containing protein [Clostridia bacterium]|nr:leucine-rich repeat domain-containing protein [Clostridia bacterium]
MKNQLNKIKTVLVVVLCLALTLLVAACSTTQYQLSYTAGTGGTITGEVTQTVDEGKDGSAVTAVANSGYVFVKWSDGLTTETRTDKNVQKDISVTAEFTVDTQGSGSGSGGGTGDSSGDNTTEVPASSFEYVCSPSDVTITKYIGNQAEVEIPAKIDGKTVVAIGNNAFAMNMDVTSISIPDSIKTIGDYAFYDCFALKNVYITNLSAWLDISFASGFSNPMHNGADLYLDNKKVTSISFPDDVTSVGDCVFTGCTSLTSLSLPDKVTSIGFNAFSSCKNLAEVSLSNSMTTIGDTAFFNCSSLQSIAIPSGIKTIDRNAFANCTSLSSVTFGADSQLLSLGEYAFADCTSLQSISLPNSLSTMDTHVFANCTGLASIAIPAGITTIAPSTFYECTGLESVSIHAGVTAIGNNAFHGCQNLSNVTFAPNSQLDSIGNYAFYLTGITSFSVPSGVTSIGDHAFFFCGDIEKITIPASVTFVGDSAFYMCEKLTIYCEATSLPDGWHVNWDHGEGFWFSQNQPTTDGNWWHYVDGVPTIWPKE